MKHLRAWEDKYNPVSATAENMQELLASEPGENLTAYLEDTRQRLLENQDTELAAKVLAVHAPLANRLNMQSLKHELENEAFRILYPQQHEMTVKLLRRNKADRDKEALHLKQIFTQHLAESGITPGDISGRSKKLYSLYKKLHKAGSISHVHDLLAVRIIVASETECYQVLDVLHGAFTPDLERLKDYIKQPKPNGYRSLHTCIYWGKKTVEVQIRTREMDEEAEQGAAAHWQYDRHKDTKHYQRGQAAAAAGEGRQAATYVFSPDGDVYAVPSGATPLDFAFAVHTNVGLRTRGARVNGRIAKLNSSLSPGDTVEIITGKEVQPKRDWLRVVQSPKARNRIRKWLKRTERNRHYEDGKQKLLEVFGGALPKELESARRQYQYARLDDLIVAVGAGYLHPETVLRLTKPAPSQKQPDGDMARKPAAAPQISHSILIAGMEGVQYRIASCCEPGPRDPIVGYITRSLGITVHKRGCPSADGEPERLVEAQWQ